MGAIFGILGGLLGLVSLVIFVIFLIRLASAKGAVHAILGFFCGLYTLYWAWTNAAALDQSHPPIAGQTYQTLVKIWLGAIGGQIVLNVLAGVMAS